MCGWKANIGSVMLDVGASDAAQRKSQRFHPPSTISMRPTDSSILKPRPLGITMLNRMIAVPTAKMVTECPTPPESTDQGSTTSTATIVLTAMT